MDIYFVAVVYIIVMASVSFSWGEWVGRRKGQQDMVIDMLARKLVTTEQLEKEYID
tara:strand:- start:105 stop:272 length:168 start_codon:yes stop_codon:yes gene_type:complete